MIFYTFPGPSVLRALTLQSQKTKAFLIVLVQNCVSTSLKWGMYISKEKVFFFYVKCYIKALNFLLSSCL